MNARAFVGTLFAILGLVFLIFAVADVMQKGAAMNPGRKARLLAGAIFGVVGVYLLMHQ